MNLTTSYAIYPDFYGKLFCYTKKQGGNKQNGKRQSIYANTEMAESLQLSEKDFKAAIIKMFQCTIANTLETNEITDNLGKETESLSK